MTAGGVDASVSAFAKSLTSAKRSTGSRDIAFETAFETSGPIDGTTVEISAGVLVNRMAITRCGVVAVNGAEPATIS